jgi:hypothetical protein
MDSLFLKKPPKIPLPTLILSSKIIFSISGHSHLGLWDCLITMRKLIHGKLPRSVLGFQYRGMWAYAAEHVHCIVPQILTFDKEITLSVVFSKI